MAYIHLGNFHIDEGVMSGQGILRRFIGEERQQCPALIEYVLINAGVADAKQASKGIARLRAGKWEAR